MEASDVSVLARFCNTDGETIGPQLSLPLNISTEQLQLLLNQHILKNDEPMPYSFFLNEEEILESLQATLKAVQKDKINTEDILTIVYQPQALFRVRSITYCSSSLPGHTEAILTVNFSPDGQRLATGSGDTTIRLWDVNTETPYRELRGHRNWVLCVKWSPNNLKLASGSMDRTVKLWDPETGECIGTLAGHREAITAIEWEPVHQDPHCRRLITSSKDGTARVWDTVLKQCLFTLSGHTGSITCVRWGGEGLIYTGSQDRTIKVWNAKEGKLVRTLTGHGHWINTMALNTDYPLRTGAFDHTGQTIEDPEEMQKKALQRYLDVKGAGSEKLATGSDDFTVFLWEATTGKKPLERLTGHGKLINIVSFSPDGRLLATASFDKNVKLWTSSGKFLATFRGHVGEVYQLCWSADSRLIVSGSKDSTMKVWDVRTRKLKEDLPGHADEVYSVDWSPDGERVGSGSKDRLLKIWRAS